MSTLQIGTIVMLAFGGIFTGVMVAVAVERVNLWGRMPVEQYAVDFRRSLFRLDPMQPILGTLTAIGAAVFALESSGTPQTLAWVAVGLIALIIAASIAIAEPMNSRFRKRREGDVPPGAEQMRARWKRFHLARTAVTVSVLVLLAAAASNV